MRAAPRVEPDAGLDSLQCSPRRGQRCLASEAKEAASDRPGGREGQETSRGARSRPRVPPFSGPLSLRTSARTLWTRKLRGALRDFQHLASAGTVSRSAELHSPTKPAAPLPRRPRKRQRVESGRQEDRRSGHRPLPLGDRFVCHALCPTGTKGFWKAQPTEVSATHSDRDHGSRSKPPGALGAAHGRTPGGGECCADTS